MTELASLYQTDYPQWTQRNAEFLPERLPLYHQATAG